MTTAAVTVITGAGRGIGAATALRLADAGHHLVLTYLQDRQSCEDVARRARAVGVQALVIGVDVAEPDDVDQLFATAVERFGTISGVVNNAGSTLHIGPLADTPVGIIRRVIEVNLLGTVLCCRAAAAIMSTERGGRGGAIVNVSSAAATTGSPGEYVHYAAAKAGVDALTVGLAKELGGQGIRVNGVAPGRSIPRSMPPLAIPADSIASPAGFRSGGWASRTRWPVRSPGCSARTRATSRARPSASPAECD